MNKPDKVFYKKVDLRSRQKMIDFLESHNKYNSGYSNNMKVYNFNLPGNEYEMLEREEARDEISMLIEDWSYNLNYTCYFEGRSGGHAVLHHKNKRYYFLEEDIEEMAFLELRETVKLVQDFDKLCDDILCVFRNFCENYTITKDEVGDKVLVENRLFCPILTIQDGERPWQGT